MISIPVFQSGLLSSHTLKYFSKYIPIPLIISPLNKCICVLCSADDSLSKLLGILLHLNFKIRILIPTITFVPNDILLIFTQVIDHFYKHFDLEERKTFVGCPHTSKYNFILLAIGWICKCNSIEELFKLAKSFIPN